MLKVSTPGETSYQIMYALNYIHDNYIYNTFTCLLSKYHTWMCHTYKNAKIIAANHHSQNRKTSQKRNARDRNPSAASKCRCRNNQRNMYKVKAPLAHSPIEEGVCGYIVTGHIKHSIEYIHTCIIYCFVLPMVMCWLNRTCQQCFMVGGSSSNSSKSSAAQESAAEGRSFNEFSEFNVSFCMVRWIQTPARFKSLLVLYLERLSAGACVIYSKSHLFCFVGSQS